MELEDSDSVANYKRHDAAMDKPVLMAQWRHAAIDQVGAFIVSRFCSRKKKTHTKNIKNGPFLAPPPSGVSKSDPPCAFPHVTHGQNIGRVKKEVKMADSHLLGFP